MYLFATDMAESYAICYVDNVPKSHFEAFCTEMFCLQETVCPNHKQNTLVQYIRNILESIFAQDLI